MIIKPARTTQELNGIYDLISYVCSFDNKCQNKTMIEIGSYIGESTEIFLQNFKTVYSIDTFEWIKLNNNSWVKSKSNYSDAEKLFDINLKKYKNLIKLKGLNNKFLNKFKNNSIDFMYIDASHDYNDVKNDIINWYPKIKINGYLAGHDYCENVNNGGVIKAVDEIFRYPDKTFSDTSWIVKKLY